MPGQPATQPGPAGAPDAPLLAPPSPGSATSSPLPSQIELPAGLIGLPELRRFRLRLLERGDLLELACLDERSFVVLAVLLHKIAPGRLERLFELGLVDPDEAVLVLLAAHGEPPTVTANLAGPIVVGPAGVARQLVIEDPAFPLRAPLGER